MPAETSSDPKFAIGHVLFIDIVGYSTLLISEQSELVDRLKQIVSDTEQFRAAESEGKLTRLPTGDGMALVFRDSQEAPVKCALQIADALKIYPELKLRMGIHSGPVNEVTDVNKQTNLAGAGINMAQRIMDCGDAGHILLSKHVAEDLEPYPRWQRYLHDLGECEVKHGVRVSVANLFSETIGNAEVPDKIKRTRRTAVRKRRGERFLIGICALAVAGLGIAYWLNRYQQARRPDTNISEAIPAKSIAVLPFENLSANPENAFFADGVQDEVLTYLSKIADL